MLLHARRANPLLDLRFHFVLTQICSKIVRGLNNFQKNNGSPHPLVVNGAWRRGDGGDGLTNANSQFWYGSISVGTPTYTGNDVFSPGPKCGSNCSGHAVYDPLLSLTSRDLGRIPTPPCILTISATLLSPEKTSLLMFYITLLNSTRISWASFSWSTVWASETWGAPASGTLSTSLAPTSGRIDSQNSE
ncbi:hypothetical protein BDN67DRAFT_760426 [Paxillus ammoniavirescens]|nr:hypothetical protein BDN67DRAFT_760426 [Paxillus ammoniavirescens]